MGQAALGAEPSQAFADRLGPTSVVRHGRIMTGWKPFVNSGLCKRQQMLSECFTLGRKRPRKEVDQMLSPRVKLALLAVASIVGAALMGEFPWGP